MPLVTQPASFTPLVDCTEFLADAARLRTAARERGYLFFRGLLPVAEVLQVRRAVLQVVADHGALAEAAALDAGIARPGIYLTEYDSTPEFTAFYADVQRLRVFHALPHYPKLVAVLEQLLGEAVWVHPRHICHPVFPDNFQYTTPPHQDFHPVRGTPDTWTVWLPFGDCDAQLGGVAVAEGSHTRGMLPVDGTTEAVEVGADQHWVWSPMATGDVLMFHSLAIHQGVDNTSPDRIRLAGSFRYQRFSEPVDGAALTPHLGVLTWDDAYADWPADDPLKYYWRSLSLQIQPPWFTNRKRKAGSQ